MYKLSETLTKQKLCKTDCWGRAAKRMVAPIQERLMSIPIGETELIFEVNVTRLGEEEFELDTFSGNVTRGPKQSAEEIAHRWSVN